MTAAVESAAHEERLELVVVRLDGTEFAFELGRVEQVFDAPRTTRVPGTPPAVRGVASIAGAVAAVLDAREVMGLPGDDNPSFVLFDRGERQAVGVLTDGVEEVRQYPTADISPAAEREEWPFPVEQRWVTAVIETPGGPLPVLSIDALCAAVAREGSERAAGRAADADGDGQHDTNRPDEPQTTSEHETQ